MSRTELVPQTKWKSVPLKRLVRIRYGLSQPPKKKEDGLPMIRATDLNQGKINNEEILYVDPDDLPESKDPFLKEDDIIVVRSGAYTGDSARVPAELDGAVAGYDLVLSPENANSEFVAWAILSDFVAKAQFEPVMGRAAQPHLNGEEVGNVKIPLPNPQQQKKIVSYINKNVRYIDELIKKNQKLIDLLDEKKEAITIRSVTKGLEPNVPFEESSFDWLGDVPKHWDIIRTRYLCKVTTGSGDTQDAVSDGQYPFIVRSPNVERADTYTFDGEGVLTAGDGVGVGKVFHHMDGKFHFHQRVYLFYDFQRILPRFFYYFLKELFAAVALAGNAKSTVDSLRRPMILDFPVAVPPIEEQEKIVNSIMSERKEINHLRDLIDKQIELLKEKRQSVITSAITGQIDLSNWDCQEL